MKIKQLLAMGAMPLCMAGSAYAQAGNTWQQVQAGNAPAQGQLMHPAHYQVYTMDEAALHTQLFALTDNPDNAQVVSLPMPDGSMRDFKVWQSSMMPDGLAEKYADIKTFTAEAVGNRAVTAKLDFTVFGFHAMVYDGDKTSFVDPLNAYHDGYYMAHYKNDEVRAAQDRMKCQVKNIATGKVKEETPGSATDAVDKAAHRTSNGAQLRTYRLALSADHYYCAAAPAATTIAAALSKMTTTMNRVNGVYEREFSVHMNFCSKEDSIIWTTATGSVNGPDPFSAIDADPNSCINTNQTECDTRIGNTNYDIGHVFTTGAGGCRWKVWYVKQAIKHQASQAAMHRLAMGLI